LDISGATAFFTAEIDHGGSKSYITSPGGFGIGWDATKREMTLMSAPVGKETNIRGNFSFSLGVDGIATIERQDLRLVLDNMSRLVEKVLDATEEECRHLRLI
jgi:hypothetical protein